MQLIKKQAYKLKLLKKQKIYNVFYILPLQKNTIKREQIGKKLTNLDSNLKLDIENNQKYKVKSIKNSIIYTKKAQSQLSGFYYLIS